jgi:uncharacterized RDD family membrane protein YckC
MHTAFDRMHSDRLLASHWVRRWVAGTIDFVLTGFTFTWLLIYLQTAATFRSPLGQMFLPSFAGGVAWFLYSAWMEGALGWTIGKKVVGLRVRTTGGSPIDWIAALGRNFTKFSGPIFLLDMLLGLSSEGDPRQRATDRMCRTTVVATDHAESFS